MTDLEKKQVEDLFKQGNGYKKIASLTGISLSTIKSFCRRIESVVDIREGNWTRCLQCSKKVIQVKGRKEKKFCSDSCRMKWWNSHQDQVKRRAVYEFTCQACGKPFTAYGNAHRKYCCRACYLKGRYGK